MCQPPDQQHPQPILPHEVPAPSAPPPEPGPHSPISECDEPLQTQDSKPPTSPILVFLITDGPDMDALHAANHSEDGEKKNLVFKVMPGALYPIPDEDSDRVIPAIDSAIPVHIRATRVYREQESDDGAIIIGQITEVSQYLGRVTGNPLWHFLHQLTKDEYVCISYDFVRKDGGLVELPTMYVGSRSDINRLGHDVQNEPAQDANAGDGKSKHKPKPKARDRYRVTPDVRQPLQYLRLDRLSLL